MQERRQVLCEHELRPETLQGLQGEKVDKPLRYTFHPYVMLGNGDLGNFKPKCEMPVDSVNRACPKCCSDRHIIPEINSWLLCSARVHA